MKNSFTLIISIAFALDLMGWHALWNKDTTTAIGMFTFAGMVLVSMLFGNYIRVTSGRNHYDK